MVLTLQLKLQLGLIYNSEQYNRDKAKHLFFILIKVCSSGGKNAYSNPLFEALGVPWDTSEHSASVLATFLNSGACCCKWGCH